MRLSMSFSMLLVVAAAPSIAAAQASDNPYSYYADCHAGSPPPSCQYTCGYYDTWCDFAGWRCSWDDLFFNMHPDVKGGETTFEKDLSQQWLSSSDEEAARDVAAGMCVEMCEPYYGGLCSTICDADDVDLVCGWEDWHCVNGTPYVCNEREP